MVTVRSFHKYRGEASFSLPGLVNILKEQIPLLVGEQTKYRVTDVPTERTIRFYTSNGLVDKPLVRQGARNLYGYRHLLQIIAIKYLQSQYIPLVKIRSLLDKADNRQIELLIPVIAPVTAAHRGLARDDVKIVERAFRPPAAGADHTPPRGEQPDPAAESNGSPRGDTWHRIEVSPGIELQVHAAALTEENRERLRGALLRELGALRGWFD